MFIGIISSCFSFIIISKSFFSPVFSSMSGYCSSPFIIFIFLFSAFCTIVFVTSFSVSNSVHLPL